MPVEKIRDRSWYHTIDLPDGSATPGWFDTRGVPRLIEWPAGLRGGRCLDVGTFDGFWAFELERRGAGEVVALDIDDPHALDWHYDERRRGPEAILAWGSNRGPGFLEAREALGSHVERLVCSVYDLDPEQHGRFDVVVCGAILLHLRDPIRALERIRSVCSGEVVIVEALEPTLELLAPRVPCARFAPHRDQWWRPNLPGLLRMLDVAGLRVTWVGKRFLIPWGAGAPVHHRSLVHALAARRPREVGILHVPLRAAPRPPADAA
jgi:tRNA (mo5U34)-methyltransferase